MSVQALLRPNPLTGKGVYLLQQELKTACPDEPNEHLQTDPHLFGELPSELVTWANLSSRISKIANMSTDLASRKDVGAQKHGFVHKVNLVTNLGFNICTGSF